MAQIQLSGGRRGTALAKLILDASPNCQMSVSKSARGDQSLLLTGPCIIIEKTMIVSAYFPDEPEDMEIWASKQLYQFALNKEGVTVFQSPEKLVIADSSADKPMALRMRVDHQADVIRFSEKLGISRNEFVLQAIEHYSAFLKSIPHLSDEPPDETLE